MSDRLAMIEKMIAAGSEDPFHHYARAMELRSLGRLEDALGAFGEVRDRFGGYVPTYLMAGQVALELDLDEDAVAWLEAGIQQAKKAGDGHAEGELSQLLATL